jgi:hypothetical protein
MENNKFVTAGWVSIAAAGIFPLAIVFMGLESEAFLRDLMEHPLGLGPSDFLFLLFAALSVYALWSFKGLMFERYSFREIGTIIWISIFWHLIYYGGSFLIELFLWVTRLSDDSGAVLMLTGLWVSGIVVFGIIDIIIGIIILRQAKRFHTSVKVFAWLTLILGFFEATLVLAVLALLLVPATFVALAFVFLSRPDTVEYV